MAVQYSTTVRNAQLDALETAVGTAPLLKIYTGSAPADCATAASGTLLVTITLPSDWMAAASSASKALSGTWSGTASAGSGATPGYFRIYDSGDTTCHMQGTAGIGSGDLSLDGTITSGQTVSVSAFTVSAANG